MHSSTLIQRILILSSNLSLQGTIKSSVVPGCLPNYLKPNCRSRGVAFESLFIEVAGCKKNVFLGKWKC